MLLTFRSNLYTSLLQSYDYVMYLRHHYLNSNVGQVLGAMLFAWSSVIAALLFAYWVYTAFHLLAVHTSTGFTCCCSKFFSLYFATLYFRTN